MSLSENDFEMFEALAENIQKEVSDLVTNNTVDENNPEDLGKLQRIIEKNVPVIPELTVSVPLGLPLYRARYADPTFVHTDDITQYGYIHDELDKIKRFRYNVAKEQVLYTATNPYIAFKEIEKANAPEYFFLSVFKKRHDGNFYIFPILPMKAKKNSIAEKFASSIDGIYPTHTSVRNWAQIIGGIMESSNEGILNKDYMFSSIAAQHILAKNDALLTVSQKSDDSELNVTFNKNAADQLDLAVVYHCKSLPFDGDLTLMFEVDEIGIVVDGHVEWHGFNIDDIQPIGNTERHIKMAEDADQYLSIYLGNLKDLEISVQESLNDYHKVLATINNQQYSFKAKIKLV